MGPSQCKEKIMAAVSEKITFAGARGAPLAARLDRPAGEIRAYALFAHCFTCSKEVFAAARIAAGLTAHGIAVLRFDFTGLGSSGGEFANTDFSSNVEDLVAAADWLRKHHAAPALLVGHSLGGAAVLAAGGDIPEVEAIATVNAPASPAHLLKLLAPKRDEIEARGEAEIELAGRNFCIRKQFLEDIEGQRLAERIAELRRALLVFHAPLDNEVGIDNAGEIFAAAKHPKSFISLDGADHLLTDRADAVYVADVLGAWTARYLPVAREEDSGAAAEPGLVRVSETGNGRFQQQIEIGTHRMLADEPADVGGDDTGPTPYGFLLAGLGACTAMTIRMYARRKEWPLDHIAVSLRHEKVHAEDCEDCETRHGMVDVIEREIALAGDLDEEQRARLMEIADKCPVHRTLHSEVQVRTVPATPA
jgi:putative redox protein